MGQCRFRRKPSIVKVHRTITVKPLCRFAMVAYRASWRYSVPGCGRRCRPSQPRDTPGRSIKSKNAVFTASVEPAEARPGATVTFKVTAKLDPGFHVYKYSKTQGPGPINTSFDFFDPAGLKIEGDWTPSREPEKHKDPNFAQVDSVDYHEDDVTWSIKLKIPEGTEPGKKGLRCQARYQVCDAKLCSIPGR